MRNAHPLPADTNGLLLGIRNALMIEAAAVVAILWMMGVI